MQLLCPDCQAAFAGATHCPKCGGRLISPQESHMLRKRRTAPAPLAVEPTAAGRVAVGTLIALGGYLGLREWVSAGLLGAAQPVSEWWSSETAAWVTFGLRVAAAMAGGLVAGSGRVGGWVTGAFTGCVTGGLLLAGDLTVHPAGPGLMTYLSTAAAAAAGLIGGIVGSLIWPKPIELPKTQVGSRGSSLLRLAQEQEDSRKGRPTQWLKVFIGGSVAFSGIVAADVVRTLMTASSAGALHMGSTFHSPVVCLELAMAFIFFGGGAAGAGTGAGVRHGILAGLLAAVGMVVLTVVNYPNILPAVEGFFWVVGVPPENIRQTASLGQLLIGVWAVTIVGGWFGGQLLPPLATPDQLRRLGTGDSPIVQVD